MVLINVKDSFSIEMSCSGGQLRNGKGITMSCSNGQLRNGKGIVMSNSAENSDSNVVAIPKVLTKSYKKVA